MVCCLPTQYKKFQSYQTLLLVTISKLSLKQFSKTFLDCFTLTDLIWSPTQFLKVSCSKEQSEDIEMERINKYELLASLPTKESPESQHTGCCNYKGRISIYSLFPGLCNTRYHLWYLIPGDNPTAFCSILDLTQFFLSFSNFQSAVLSRSVKMIFLSFWSIHFENIRKNFHYR